MLNLKRILDVWQTALILAGLVLLWPRSMGGVASYVMVSGESMVPTLQDGDLALLWTRRTYYPGDLVAFRVPEDEPGEGAVIIHRIVGESRGKFIVQGDNKSSPDPWEPDGQDILGSLGIVAPGGGRVLGFFRQPILLGAIAGLTGMVFVLSSGKKPQPSRHKGFPGQRRLAVGPTGLQHQEPYPRQTPPAPGPKSGPWPPGSHVARSIPKSWNAQDADRASTRVVFRATQKDGRVRLRRELPPNAQVYLVWDWPETHWQVVAEDASRKGEPMRP
jgi:signal peptidase